MWLWVIVHPRLCVDPSHSTARVTIDYAKLNFWVRNLGFWNISRIFDSFLVTPNVTRTVRLCSRLKLSEKRWSLLMRQIRQHQTSCSVSWLGLHASTYMNNVFSFCLSVTSFWVWTTLQSVTTESGADCLIICRCSQKPNKIIQHVE